MDYKQKNLIDALLEDEIDVLVHGCNCFNTMGAGIAKQIKFQFPEVYKLDCTTKKGNRSKLGTTNYVEYKRNYHHGKFYVVNCYTQFTYWDIHDMLDYNAVESCMKQINLTFQNMRIGLPKIGAGLARGNWNKIEKIIENTLIDMKSVTIYYL